MRSYKYIYKITNTITNKFYIGKTIHTIEKRFLQHCSNNGKSCSDLKIDIHKYGKDNFKIEIIDIAVSEIELHNKERYWILRTDAINNGYNKTIPAHKYDCREYVFGLTTVYKFKLRKNKIIKNKVDIHNKK